MEASLASWSRLVTQESRSVATGVARKLLIRARDQNLLLCRRAGEQTGPECGPLVLGDVSQCELQLLQLGVELIQCWSRRRRPRRPHPSLELAAFVFVGARTKEFRQFGVRPDARDNVGVQPRFRFAIEPNLHLIQDPYGRRGKSRKAHGSRAQLAAVIEFITTDKTYLLVGGVPRSDLRDNGRAAPNPVPALLC